MQYCPLILWRTKLVVVVMQSSKNNKIVQGIPPLMRDFANNSHCELLL